MSQFLYPSRRAFLKQGALLLTTSAAATSWAASTEGQADDTVRLRIGLVTDLHHADKPAAGTRHYRQSLSKLEEAGSRFERVPVDFVVELGDLIDAADSVDVELGYLKTVNRAFSALCQDRHYVLGNHCVDTLNKQEFLGGVDREKSYYSFRRQGWHFIVLDACFRSDGVAYQRRNFDWKDANISAEELEWLTADLQQGKEPVIVFAHQRLDVADAHGVRNAPDVRRILERSGRVRAVFQGHSHQNDLKLLEGIPYCTLVAMVEGDGLESSGYSVLECMGNESLRLQGFRRQTSRHWGSVSD